MSHFSRHSMLGRAWATVTRRPFSKSLRSSQGRRPYLKLEPLEDRLTPSVYAVTNTNSSGPGSLAAAVAQANADSYLGAPTINFTGSIFATPQTITTAATLNLTFVSKYTVLTINGPAAGVTINGGGPGANGHTVFEISPQATVALNGLTITGGVASIPDPNIVQNVSYPQYAGGGIFIYAGNVQITNCIVEDNSANFAGGGIYSFDTAGYGVNGFGRVTLSNVTISGNTVSSANHTAQFNPYGGGGICNDSQSSMTLTNVTLSGNVAVPNSNATLPNAGGGGILNANSDAYDSFTLNVNDTTFSGNSAAQGGGLFNGGYVNVTNSTFSGNTAVAGGPVPTGGGIYNGATSTPAIIDSTISGNSAQSGGGIFNSSSMLTLQNTVVAGNTATSSAPDVSGTVTTANNDLIGDSTGVSGISNGTNGNIVGASADLAPLSSYGGPTQTIALLPGSPALGAGSTSSTTDQRGNSRINPFGANSFDIGAWQAPYSAAVIETSDMQDMSLWPSATTLSNPLGQGGVATLQTNGQFTLTSASGMSTVLDNQTRAIAAGVTPAGQPALFDLKTTGVLYQYSQGAWTLMDNFTQGIVGGLTSSGQAGLFDLETIGVLYQYGVGGWTLLDNQAAAIFAGVSAGGQPALFDLKNGGNVLYQYTTGGWTLLDDGAGTITTGVTSTGQPALFDRKHIGTALYQYSVGGWSLLDDGAGSIYSGMTAAGQPGLFDLKNGMVYQYSVGGWALLDDGAGNIYSGVSATGAPALFDLKHNHLYQYSIAGWTLLDDQAQTVWNDIIAVGSVVLYDLKTTGHVYQYALGGFTLGA
jgi:hypothetical protein